MFFKDQIGRTIELNSPAKRIVSLVPSQTELLYDLGLEDEVLGITKFCIKPEHWYKTKKRVGGTKNANIQAIQQLKPDLIIGNKEENSEEDIRVLETFAPVWMSDIYTLSDAFDMIQSVGELADRKSEAQSLISSIEQSFSTLKVIPDSISPTVAYLIWKDPDLLAGKKTFIDDMLSRCGFINVTSEERYPAFNSESNPDFIFLSTEPYPFKQEHLEEFSQRFPAASIKLVDGEMFSWYGSRLKYAPEYYNTLLKEVAR